MKGILNDPNEYLHKEAMITWPDKEGVSDKNLNPGENNRLFEKKAFTNFQLHTAKGIEVVEKFSPQDNFIIKGDNLVVLHSAKDVFKNKVKLIYIDPPYNTGNVRFNYNDNFYHADWLTFMRNRIEIGRDLLTEDGTLWINIDDSESHYLKVMCDEIFGRENFVINFIWQKKYSPANDAKWFSDTHDHILVFAKNKQLFKPNLLPRSEAMNKRYANPDNDPRGPWKPGGYSVKSYSKDYDYPVETPSGKIVYPPKGSCWQTSKENYEKKLADNRIWFGVKGSSKPQIKQFLSEVQQGMVAKSIWLFDEVGHNQVSRREIVKLFGDLVFATPKPEKLMKRIIDLATNKGDRVLDFFLGSGTTAAVAHKMNRGYIGIDQMDYIKDVAVGRLQKVIAGEQGGVSFALGWKGGGRFIYMELVRRNTGHDAKNDHYLNFSEITNSGYEISADDIFLNQKFYSSEL
jgi:adenine-specific DNA-methyltransferase